MIWIIIFLILVLILVSLDQIKKISSIKWKSKFVILETQVNNIKSYQLENQKIYQIFSSWVFEWKKMDFASPKYYFDINDKIKLWDKIQVEVNILRSSEYRFLDDQLF